MEGCVVGGGDTGGVGGDEGVVMKDLALHDLALVATDEGGAAWRREDMFADDSGARLQPFMQECVSILTITTTAAVAAPPSAPTTSTATAAASNQHKKWNAVPLAVLASTSNLPSSIVQQQDSITAIATRYQRTKLAVRVVSEFAVASCTQDRYGIVQLVSPTLGEVVVALVQMLFATQQLIKQHSGCGAGRSGTATRAMKSLGPWRGTGDVAYSTGSSGNDAPACMVAAVYALRDELTTALGRITSTFGPSLKEAVLHANTTASKSEVINLLSDQFYCYQ